MISPSSEMILLKRISNGFFDSYFVPTSFGVPSTALPTLKCSPASSGFCAVSAPLASGPVAF
jgi:hypothetical protein